MSGSGKIWYRMSLVGTLATGLATSVALSLASPAEPPTNVTEQEQQLVRDVYQARDSYQASLERLRAYYIHTNNEENKQWVEKELTAYHLMVKNPYLLELDLPSPDLKPDTSLPNANRIFREALEWYNRRTMLDREENYKRAELLLRRLIRDYPRSDKLDEACYYLGEIYSSKYFQQYRRAVAFYERVFLYEPNTNLDARLRAANLYEKYFANQRRAIELYQEVLRREIDPDQTKEARRRLDSLLNSRGPSLLR